MRTESGVVTRVKHVSVISFAPPFVAASPQKTALAASEILRNERKVLTEVIDNNRCLLEFMEMMDSHKEVVP